MLLGSWRCEWQTHKGQNSLGPCLTGSNAAAIALFLCICSHWCHELGPALGASLHPSCSAEFLGGREKNKTGWSLFCPKGVLGHLHVPSCIRRTHRNTCTLCLWALTVLVSSKEKLRGGSRLTKMLIHSSGHRPPSLDTRPSRRQQHRAKRLCVKKWVFSNNFGCTPHQLTCCRHLTFRSAKPLHPLWIISDFTQCKADYSVGPFTPDLWVPYILLWERHQWLNRYSSDGKLLIFTWPGYKGTVTHITGKVSLRMLSSLNFHLPYRTALLWVMEMLPHGDSISKRYQASPSSNTGGLHKGCQPAVGIQVFVSLEWTPTEDLGSMVPCALPCGQGITTHPPSQGGEGVWSRSPCSLYQVFIFVRATRLTSRCVLKFLKQLGGKPWAASIAAAWIPFPDLCLFSLMRLCYWYSIVPTKTSRNVSAGIWPYSSLQEKWTFFIWHLNLKPTHDWLQCLTDRASQPPVPFLYPSWAHGNDKTDVGGCSLFIWFMKQAVQHWAKGVVVLLHFCGFRIQNIFYQQFSISTEHLSHWSMWLVLVTCS